MNFSKTEINSIIKARKEKKLIPFIGAGFSKNMKLPNWEDVINIIADELDWSPQILKLNGDFYQIAEYYKIKNDGSISKLRSKLDVMFNNETIDISDSKIHSLLVDLDFPIIYTTNWDSLIEKAYEKKGKDYQVIRTLSDISRLSDKTQIVKFHGDFQGQDDDIVFTENSYFKRLNFDSPLDIKFRSDILGRTILFIGYSFSDINIRFIWHKLMILIERIKYNNYPKSFIISTGLNLLQEELFKNKNIGIISLDSLNIEKELEEFLEIISKNKY